MRAQTADEPVASIGDLASQLDELRRQIRVLCDVPRRPAVSGVWIVIGQRSALAGHVRELSHLSQLAEPLFDPALHAP
jgi:hypothetical protein